MLSAAVCTVHPVMADSIFDRIRSIVTDIYGQIVAISTIVAVTVASIALIVRMISRNQRAVDEATSWLKRVVVGSPAYALPANQNRSQCFERSFKKYGESQGSL